MDAAFHFNILLLPSLNSFPVILPSLFLLRNSASTMDTQFTSYFGPLTDLLGHLHGLGETGRNARETCSMVRDRDRAKTKLRLDVDLLYRRLDSSSSLIRVPPSSCNNPDVKHERTRSGCAMLDELISIIESMGTRFKNILE
jgi:hypothetical protein